MDSPSKLSTRWSSGSTPSSTLPRSVSFRDVARLEVVHPDLVRLGRRREREGDARPVRGEDEVLRDSVTRQRAGRPPASSRPRSRPPARCRPAVVAEALEVPLRLVQRPPSRRRACSERSRTCRGPRSSRRGSRTSRRARPASMYSAWPSCGVTWTTSPVSTPSRNRFESPLSSPSCPATTQRPSGENSPMAHQPPSSNVRSSPLSSYRTTTSKSRPLRRFVEYASSAPSRETCGERWM